MEAASKQRLACVAVATLLVMAFANSPQRSPDGIEMIAMVRGWFSEKPSGVAAWYWPPLWPILAVGLGLGRWAEPAGYMLNAGCAAGTAYFLYGLASRATGQRAEASWVPALVTLAYATLPAIHEQVATLDARALGSFLLVAAAESTLSARAASPGATAQKAWLFAGSLAFLAPLARPEGVLTAAGVAAVAGFGAMRTREGRADPRLWAVALATIGIAAGAFLGSGRAWETLTLPWIGVWPRGDILALYGFASAPTPYREWVLASGMELGRPSLPSLGTFVAAVFEVMHTHASAMGLAIVATGMMGAAALSRTHAAISLVIVLPVVLLALSPQRSGQLSASANVSSFIPLWLVLSAALLSRLPRLLGPLMLGSSLALAWIEAGRTPRTQFVEGSALTAAAADWLAANVPPQSPVYCSFSSRAAVRDAGLVPVATPSPFEVWAPAEGAWLVISSVDARGNDAGRTLDIGEDPAWKLVELLSANEQSGGMGHWYAFLRRESR